MHDGTVTFDYMPSQFITFRLETGYRYSDTPYWTGRGGITPPAFAGGPPTNNGQPAHMPAPTGLHPVTAMEASVLPKPPATAWGTGQAPTRAIWWPDLRTNQTVSTIAIMVRFLGRLTVWSRERCDRRALVSLNEQRRVDPRPRALPGSSPIATACRAAAICPSAELRSAAWRSRPERRTEGAERSRRSHMKSKARGFVLLAIALLVNILVAIGCRSDKVNADAEAPPPAKVFPAWTSPFSRSSIRSCIRS